MNEKFCDLQPYDRWLLAYICEAGREGRPLAALTEHQRLRAQLLEDLRLVQTKPGAEGQRQVSFTEYWGPDTLALPLAAHYEGGNPFRLEGVVLDGDAVPACIREPNLTPYFAVVVGEGHGMEMIGAGTSKEAAWAGALDAALFTSTLRDEKALRTEMIGEGYRTIPIDVATHARACAGKTFPVECV